MQHIDTDITVQNFIDGDGTLILLVRNSDYMNHNSKESMVRVNLIRGKLNLEYTHAYYTVLVLDTITNTLSNILIHNGERTFKLNQPVSFEYFLPDGNIIPFYRIPLLRMITYPVHIVSDRG